MKLKKAGLRNGLVLGTVTGVAFGLASVVGAGTASAATTTLDYTCSYPLIGSRLLKIKIDTNIPAKVGVSQNTGKIQVNWTATLGADTTEGLKAVDAVSIVGAAAAKAAVSGPGQNINVNVGNALQSTNIPDEGPFDIKGFGEAPGVRFDAAGQATAKLGDMNLTVLLKKQDGNSSALGEFTALCTPLAGQDTTVAKLDVVPEQQTLTPPATPPAFFPYTPTGAAPGKLNYAFNLAGESAIKRANGKVPLTGGIDVEVDGKTGDILGNLNLKQTKGRMSILGFLPVDATVDFQQVGQTTGSYVNGEIKTKSTMFIKFPAFTLLGIPLGGGANCKTTQPSVIDMGSTTGVFFNPKKGGPYKSPAYSISSIQDCGPLTSIIGIFAAGPGNTIDLTLSPKA